MAEIEIVRGAPTAAFMRSLGCSMFAAWALCALAPGVAADARPAPVSPGALEQVAEVAAVCPTFNWAGIDGAVGYDLVVFAAPAAAAEEGMSDPGEIRLRPVLQHRIPGGALGWTPPAGRCLQRGGTYGWVVRAVGREGTGAWSEPYSFRVSNAPSEDEVRTALEVLRGYLGEEDGDSGDGASSEPTRQAVGAPAQPVVLSGVDAGHASTHHLALGPSGSGPPPPAPIEFFTVDNTGSVFAPLIKANFLAGDGAAVTNVNAVTLGGKSRFFFSGGTHDHEPHAVCGRCPSQPAPGCAELCELNLESPDALETRCYGRTYDSGGPTGEYGNDEDAMLTVCSPNGVSVSAFFTSFALEQCCDRLFIIDGLGTPTDRCIGVPAAPPTLQFYQTLLGTFDGTASPGFVTSNSGCLTFLFCSDGANTAAGWEAHLSCF